MKRPGYREAIFWIAMNDEPGEGDYEVIAGLISVVLVADLFGVEAHKVAADVIIKRRKEGLI